MRAGRGAVGAAAGALAGPGALAGSVVPAAVAGALEPAGAVPEVGAAVDRLAGAGRGDRSGSLRAANSAAAIPIPTASAPPENHSHHGVGAAPGGPGSR